MRLILRVGIALALLWTLPAALSGQTGEVKRSGFEVGVSTGLPFDLFQGPFDIDRRGLLQGEDSELAEESPLLGNAFRTPVLGMSYRERLTWPVELWASFRWSVSPSLALRLRLRRGASRTEASFQGGGGPPRTLSRRMAWSGLDVTGSFPMAGGGPWRLDGVAGGSATLWSLDPRGAGNDAMVSAATLQEAPAPVAWGEKSWGTVGLVLGADLEYAAGPEWSFGLGLRQRVTSVWGGVFAEAWQEEIRRSTGEDGATLEAAGTAATHVATPRSVTLSVSWRPLARPVRDPGKTLLELRREDAARDDRRRRDPDLPPDFHAAMAEADTAAAIRALEAATELALPNPATVKGELGLLLAYTAPAEELEFSERDRARKLLNEALDDDPGNPRYYLALGVLLEKAGMRVDARTVMDRGLEEAADHPEVISDRELAEVFYRTGHTLEERVKEFVDLRAVPPEQARLGTLGCQAPGSAFCMNWTDPERFFDHFRSFTDLTDLVSEDRARMLEQYERAVSVLPSHEGAWRGLLRAPARERSWPALRDRARAWAEADPANPWSGIFLAAARTLADGSYGDADSMFERSLPELDPEDRAVFLDLRPLLPTALEGEWVPGDPGANEAFRQVWFRARDPLYLSDANERRVEHFTRVALAELLFGEAAAGNRGWETERGRILVRYGVPRSRWQVRRDDRRILRPRGLEGPPTAGDMGGGRWIFWSYAPDQPAFVFEKRLGRSSVRHMSSSESAFMARDLKARQPTTFADPHAPLGPLTFQSALFRDESGRGHQLEVHGRVWRSGPADVGSDSVEVGLFLHRRSNLRRAGEARDVRPPGDRDLDVRVTGLAAGVYRYSVEAATPDRERASVRRGEVEVPGTSGEGLALSDLLLAHQVVARVQEPSTRADLGVDPLRCTAVPESRSLWVVFEAYGLEARDGVVRYRIDLETGDARDEGAVVRFLRGLARPFLGDEEEPGVLSYEREVETSGAGRVVDWFEVRLPGTGSPPGRMELRVTDLRSGAEARRVRSVDPEACPDAG